MHEIKEYIQKIVDNGDRREMENLSDILDEIICVIKEYDENLYKKYKMELYSMAYGKRLNRQMAEEIVSKMKPYKMHWSLEETRDIQEEFGLQDLDEYAFFVVINSAYNDYRNIFGDNLDMYTRYTRDFIEDEDADEDKVFKYFTTIPK